MNIRPVFGMKWFAERLLGKRYLPTVLRQVFQSKLSSGENTRTRSMLVLSKGVGSNESTALRAANKRIKSLARELQLVKDASEVCDSQVVANPQGSKSSRSPGNAWRFSSQCNPGCRCCSFCIHQSDHSWPAI